jgi:hypothetical protein
MSWFDRISPTLFGRRFGLQSMSSNVSGSGRTGQSPDFLVGPEDVRIGVTTAETTATNIAAYGVSYLVNSSAGSSQVFTLDPPIPGVRKTIIFGTTVNTQYVKTANSETFISTLGTSMTVAKSTQLSIGALNMIGLTTAQWGVSYGLSTASLSLTTTT